jgi:hypothetical protein
MRDVGLQSMGISEDQILNTDRFLQQYTYIKHPQDCRHYYYYCMITCMYPSVASGYAQELWRITTFDFS